MNFNPFKNPEKPAQASTEAGALEKKEEVMTPEEKERMNKLVNETMESVNAISNIPEETISKMDPEKMEKFGEKIFAVAGFVALATGVVLAAPHLKEFEQIDAATIALTAAQIKAFVGTVMTALGGIALIYHFSKTPENNQEA